MDSNQLEQMLTVEEVARLLHIHVNTVRRWSNKGIIKSYRINYRGDRRYSRRDIMHFLNKLNANGGDERKASQQNRGARDGAGDVHHLIPSGD